MRNKVDFVAGTRFPAAGAAGVHPVHDTQTKRPRHGPAPARQTVSSKLVDRLIESDDPKDIARLEAQARLIAAYEERKWPRHAPSVSDLLTYLMDQHGLTRADLAPVLGTPSRVSEILAGKKGLSMAMVQRLRTRFRVPADLLIPAAGDAPGTRSAA